MQKYMWFLAFSFLSLWASTAKAILLYYNSTEIPFEEVLGITDNFTSSETTNINISEESDYFFYSNFESMISETVSDILDNPQFPQNFNSLHGTETSPIPEPSVIVLMGLGLISLAIVGRKQFK